MEKRFNWVYFDSISVSGPFSSVELFLSFVEDVAFRSNWSEHEWNWPIEGLVRVWLLFWAEPSEKVGVLSAIKAQNRAPSLANPPPFLSSSLGFQINKIHSLVTSLFLISCLIFTSSVFTFPQSGSLGTLFAVALHQLICSWLITCR